MVPLVPFGIGFLSGATSGVAAFAGGLFRLFGSSGLKPFPYPDRQLGILSSLADSDDQRVGLHEDRSLGTRTI